MIIISWPHENSWFSPIDSTFSERCETENEVSVLVAAAQLTLERWRIFRGVAVAQPEKIGADCSYCTLWLCQQFIGDLMVI